jgi:uncharacterized protein YjeT (DUF2065 family)
MSTLSPPAGMIPWMLNLATRMLARLLNMPEPLLHSTGVFVFAHVQAAENSVGRRCARSACCVSSWPYAANRHVDPSTAPTKRRTVMIDPSPFLRRVILADAIFSGVSALLLTFGAGTLAPWLNLPEALLRETGLFLIAYALLVGWLGTRQAMPKPLVVIVISGNAVWTLASIALLFSGAVMPNLLGEAFVAIQAIAVGALAELQYLGLRKSGDALAA